MTSYPQPGGTSGQLAIDTATQAGDGWSGRIAAVVSAVALTFSAYSLWETSLRAPDLRIFVPPVIHYSSPYQNSNFEMVSIPVTITNEGARTGTVLAIDLDVTDPRTNETKRFYAADIGRWSMERTRAAAYQHFAPVALAGRTSKTETILFYPKGEAEKPQQVIREVAAYKFKLTIDVAEVDDFGPFDRFWKRTEPTVRFERVVRFFDARAFQNGTIPLDAKDWKSTASGG
jgi:hypothetical protein